MILRGLCTTALLLLAACGAAPPAQIPARAAATVPLPHFDDAAATRLLVASFPSLTPSDLADELPGLIDSERRRLEATAPSEPGSVPRALDVKRISAAVETHAEAHALLGRIGADVLVWGSLTCGGPHESGPIVMASPATLCVHVTIDLALDDLETPADKQLNLDWLTDFDFPPLAPSSRLGLADYLVGVHLQGVARYALAVQALSEASALFTAEGRDPAWIDSYLAQAELHLDDRSAATSRAGAALFRKGKKGGAVDSSLFLTLGDARRREGDPLGAGVYYARAQSAAGKVPGVGRPHLAAIENRSGFADAERGDPAGALGHFHRARALAESFLGPDHVVVAHDWERIGEQLTRAGGVGADEAFEHAMAIYRVKQGPESADVARIEEQLGTLSFRAGDHAHAVERFRRALTILEKQRVIDVEELMIFRDNLAHALSKHGDHAEALLTLRSTRDFAESANVHDHGASRLAASERNLARELLAKGDDGDYPEATALLLAASAIDVKVHGATSRQVAEAETEVGSVMVQHADLERAFEHFSRALVIDEAILPLDEHRIDKDRTLVAIAIAARSGRKPEEKSPGVVVTGCCSNPALTHGLKAGDWLVSFGPTKIEDQEHLHALVHGLAPAQKVTLTLRREGKQIRLPPLDPRKIGFSYTGWVMLRQ